MRAHVIENGTVANTIEVASLDAFPNLIDADLYGGSIGWTWDGVMLSPPPEPSPPFNEALAREVNYHSNRSRLQAKAESLAKQGRIAEAVSYLSKLQ